MEAKGLLISGAKGQRFESSRAYHKQKHLRQFFASYERLPAPIENRIVDDSDSLVTRQSKGSE